MVDEETASLDAMCLRTTDTIAHATKDTIWLLISTPVIRKLTCPIALENAMETAFASEADIVTVSLDGKEKPASRPCVQVLPIALTMASAWLRTLVLANWAGVVSHVRLIFVQFIAHAQSARTHRDVDGAMLLTSAARAVATDLMKGLVLRGSTIAVR